MKQLQPGDRVTIGATHSVEIDGEKSWIKMEINSAVQDSETAVEAILRVNNLVAHHIVETIETQAGPIVAANQKQREQRALRR